MGNVDWCPYIVSFGATGVWQKRLRSKGIYEGLQLEKGILFNKGKEIRNCKATVRISDTLQELLKNKGNYGCREGVYGAMGAAATAKGHSEQMQSNSVDKMVVQWIREWGECSCFKDLHRQFLYAVQKGGYKSLHREL